MAKNLREMNHHLKYTTILLAIFFWWLYWPSNSHSEFYKYVDEQGRVFYVDDLNKVPEAYLDQVQIYQEKYDNLSKQDRSQALRRESEYIERQEREKQLRVNQYLQEVQAAEEAENRRKAENAKQKLMERMQTRVFVDGNRILVPVTLVNSGIELDVNMLLDTGASQIVLHRNVADQLNIIALSKGLAQVAGGQKIYVETGQVDYFKVGPFKMEKATALIIAYEGPPVSYSGLLGMNFLKNVQYIIDYQDQIIHWQAPASASDK
jgi:predicted aspartyl protease/Skp family chaperone for outer membrane proteins